MNSLLLRSICSVLPRYRYRFANERQLQDGIAEALSAHGIEYRREVRVSDEDRLDFLCEAGIVIEAKIEGSLPAALRQVDRYAQLPACEAIVIAAAKAWAFGYSESFEIRNKPVHIVRLQPQAF